MILMQSLNTSDVHSLIRSLKTDEVTEQDVRRLFEACDALWLHSGDPKHPHAELTSGKCSDGFVDVLRVLRYTPLCELFARELKRIFVMRYPQPVDWVVGSDHAAATLSYEIARQLQVMHDFTEKGAGKIQNWKRFEIEPNSVVLQVEELVTTTGTIGAVRDALNQDNPHPVVFAPFILTLIHRSNVYEYEGSPILSLAHFDIKTWQQRDCPLCKAGSERVRPKQHWGRLTAPQRYSSNS